MTLRGVLWDLDGVLVDTGEFHYVSWRETLPEYNIPFSYELFRKSFGMNNEGVLNFLMGHKPNPDLLAEIDNRKESAFRQAIRGHAQLLPGVVDWLEALHQAGVRMAVGSSAPMANVEVLVDETGIRPYFQVLVSANGKPSKPDPWVFLHAAQQIGVPAEACWVVEDAVTGVEAAHRAGMRCIAVTTTNTTEALSAAEIVVDRLDQLSPDVLWKKDKFPMAKYMHTLTGPVLDSDLGLVLPHEHIFVDLRGPSVPDYAQADADDVIRLMKPYLDAAWTAGVTVFIECTPPGVGRNLTILRRVAEITPIRILTPTGIYREAFTPSAMRNLSVEALADIWIRELAEGIEGTPVRAGFIKLAMSDNGPTDIEIRNLEAAVKASLATGAVIASHTTNGAIMQCELRVLEKAGLNLDRFIWVHADAEPDPAFHLEAARRGAYVEIDAIGTRADLTAQLNYTAALIEAGYTDRILLSHDAGWYEPGQPGGRPAGGVRSFTALVEDFLPRLRSRGIQEDIIHQITVINPFQAFAF